MTLTTLSSKELKPLYIWALKRNKSVIIIYSLFLIVFGPVMTMYFMSTSSTYGYDYKDLNLIILILFQIISAFFTFVSSLKTFSYLHNKRSVDMFGALPANRTTMYTSHLLAGLTSIAVPYFVFSIITIAITARSGDTLKFGLYTIGSTLLMIFAAYIFTSLVAYCCGTVVDTAIITIGANGIWLGIISLYFGFITEMIPGVDFESIIDTPLLVMFAPYGFSLMGTIYYQNEQVGSLVSLFIWNMIYIAGFLFVALIAANKRKAETSQNGFSVKWLPMVIKAGASIVCGGFIGFISAEVSHSGYNNMFVFCFWYAIIGFVAFAILHIIFARGLKGKVIPSLLTYLGTTAVAIAILFGFSFGIGIDVYVPSPVTVKSVQFDGMDFKDPENIKTVTEIHKIITKGIRKENIYPYYLGSESYSYDYPVTTYDEETVTNELPSDLDGVIKDGEYYIERDPSKNYYVIGNTIFRFRYKRKIGFGVTRDYYLYPTDYRKKCYDYDKLSELIMKLYSSEEYKKNYNKDLFDDEAIKNITSAGLNYFYYIGENGSKNYISSGKSNLSTNENFMNGFREALRQDILEDQNYIPNVNVTSYGQSTLTPYVGKHCIELHTVYTYSRDDTMPYSNHYDYAPNYDSRTYTITTLIKDSYKNTQKYLSDHQIVPDVVTNYSDYSNNYPQSYYDFLSDGRPDTLRKLTQDVSVQFALTACSTVHGIDPNQWLDDNYDDYRKALLKKSDELYKKYFGSVSTPDQPVINDEDYPDTPNAEKVDLILNELFHFTFEYIDETINNKSAV